MALIAAFYSWLAYLTLNRPNPRLGALALFVILAMFFAAQTLRAFVTSVRLEETHVVARSLCGTVSEEYQSLRRVSLLPGKIRLEFFDDKTIDVCSGLGDHEIVIRLLRHYCPGNVWKDDPQIQGRQC